MLEHIFKYFCNDKFNMCLTCRAFDYVVDEMLTEDELFKIAHRERLRESEFNAKLINQLVKQSEQSKNFVLKYCKTLHKAGFDMDHIFTLAQKEPKTQSVVLNNFKVLHAMGADMESIYYLASKNPSTQTFMVENGHALLKIGFSLFHAQALSKKTLRFIISF